MNRILKRANNRLSLSNAAVLLISTAFIGQALGFLRTKMVNANFSAYGPQSTDAYFAAFKIPDFFFFTVAAGALGVAFMPVLADKLELGDRKSVWELSSSLLNLLSIVMAVVAVFIIIFAEPLLHNIVAPTLSPAQLSNSVMIMRLIALNPLLFTVSGILTSVEQTFGRFFFYAIAPLFYNLSIIASIFIFKDNIGIVGIGFGALLGAIVQLFIVSMGLFGTDFKYHMKIRFKNPDFRLILRQLPPRSIDQGIDSINSIVETNLAQRIGEGRLSFYENAYTLHNAPTLLIGTAISTAAFPRLIERLAQGRVDLFRIEFLKILRVMIWIISPVTIVSYFARGYLARMIFSRNAPEIAAIFGFLVGAIFFRTIYSMLSRWFYAQKDTRTTLYVSLFAIALNIYLAYTLSRPDAYGVEGLAMAQTLVAASEVFILCAIILKRDHKMLNKSFIAGCAKIISVSGFTVVTAYIMVSIFPLQIDDQGVAVLGTKLLAITGVTSAVYLGFSVMFGLEETKPVIKRIKRLILKPVNIDF